MATSTRSADHPSAVAKALRADLRALKRHGIDPRTFIGGHHEHLVRRVSRAAKACRA